MKNVRLQAARESAGLTQKQVATEAGITEQAYQKYEYGKRRPNAEISILIADAIGITDFEQFKKIFGAATAESLGGHHNEKDN